MINKKGMTLVELIVTFALVLVVVVGLYNLILEIKLQLEEKQIIKDVTEYSATINNKIHYDILRNEPFAVLYSSTGDSWNHIGSGITNDGQTNKYMINSNIIGVEQLNPTTGTLKGTSYCKNIFPCFIYFYVDGTEIKKGIISVNTNTEGTMGLGIVYNGTFEEIPNQDRGNTQNKTGYIDKTAIDKKVREETESAANYFELDDTNQIFTMVYPIYIKDDNTNYGFKISYPLQ